MKSRFALIAAATAGLMISSYGIAVAAQAAAPLPPGIPGALANPNRPAEDKARDAVRKPQALLDFAGVKKGDIVAELVGGQGYMSRILANLVGGPEGHLYIINSPTLNERFKAGPLAVAAGPMRGIATVMEMPYETLKLPQPVDVVWTSENYHDFNNMGMFKTDTAAMNRAIFAALKPGGHYIITDYVGKAGSGKTETQTLHRIDPAVIKQEVQAAGFQLEAESNVLMNAADNMTTRSTQESSQIVLKFRKP